MLIDHTGAVLFPHTMIFRIIGRLAFPIFVYLISQGLIYTSNIRKYLWRLFLFALISEVPFDLAFQQTPFYWKSQNVFFTLFLGLAAIAVLHKLRGKGLAASFLAILFAAAMAYAAELLNTDYGWFGVAAVIIFYCLRNYRTRGVIVFSLVLTGYSLMTGTIELFALPSGIPIALYNGKKGKWNWKYFFYVFYPAHLLILFFIHTVAN